MRKLIYVSFFLFAITACNSKSDSISNEEKIAGQSEKTWEAKKETDASGDNDKITKDEKKQRITFSRNGNVKMGDGSSVMSGQWTLEGTNLRLHFTGENVTENFTVLKLEDDNLNLKAGDGSELMMKPE